MPMEWAELALRDFNYAGGAGEPAQQRQTKSRQSQGLRQSFADICQVAASSVRGRPPRALDRRGSQSDQWRLDGSHLAQAARLPDSGARQRLQSFDLLRPDY